MDNTRFASHLAAMQRLGASSLHLVSGRPPRVRVQRRGVELETHAVTAEEIEEFVRDLLFADHRAQLAKSGHVEVLYMDGERRRYRVGVAECADALTLTFRLLPDEVPTPEGLDLPGQVTDLIERRSGLVLVAGFFGSGKSTTLAALAGHLANDGCRHIVAIEDSIEFVFGATPAVVQQQEVGTHVTSAAAGIRQAVAIGADAITVSDVRDVEALQAALDAADAGVLVIGGIESGSVASALSELVNLATGDRRSISRERLARVLRGVTSQYLVPRSHRAGRVAVVEILQAIPAVREVIRSGEFHRLHEIMHRYRGVGMQTTQAALQALRAAHLIGPDEVGAAALDSRPVPTGDGSAT